MFITVVLTSLSRQITALPVDRLVAWCLCFGTLMVCCGTLSLLRELERREAQNIGPRTGAMAKPVVVVR